jgi:hypothetical protein
MNWNNPNENLDTQLLCDHFASLRDGEQLPLYIAFNGMFSDGGITDQLSRLNTADKLEPALIRQVENLYRMLNPTYIVDKRVKDDLRSFCPAIITQTTQLIRLVKGSLLVDDVPANELISGIAASALSTIHDRSLNDDQKHFYRVILSQLICIRYLVTKLAPMNLEIVQQIQQEMSKEH